MFVQSQLLSRIRATALHYRKVETQLGNHFVAESNLWIERAPRQRLNVL